jgi:hypothetical protein
MSRTAVHESNAQDRELAVASVATTFYPGSYRFRSTR